MRPCPPSTSSPRSTMQEVRNAVDQAGREIANRYDFKGTSSTIELEAHTIKLHSSSEDRLAALRTVLEEKLVKRGVSLKAVEYGKVEEASGRHGPPDRHADRRHLLGQGPRAQQAHQGPGAEGHPVPDPGRSAPGHGQEARRPAGRHRRPQGRRLRHPPAVRQLQGLSSSATARRPCGGGRRGRRWAGGCGTGCRTAPCGR